MVRSASVIALFTLALLVSPVFVAGATGGASWGVLVVAESGATIPLVQDSYSWSGGGLRCPEYGDPSSTLTGTWGSRNDCTSISVGSSSEGAFHFGYYVGDYSCPGPAGTLDVPGADVWVTDAQIVTFRADSGIGSPLPRYDNYCDRSPPPAPSVTALSQWYRNMDDTDITITYSESGGGRAWRAILNHNPGGNRYPVCPGVSGSASGSLRTCTINDKVEIGPSQFCNVEGEDACQLVVRAQNYWQMQGSPTTRTYDVDFSDPETTFDGWGRPADHTESDGTLWFADDVDYTIDCTDTYSGCDTIWRRTRSGASYVPQEVDGRSTSHTFNEDRTGAQSSALELSFYADDNALSEPGNQEAPNFETTVYIDGAAPTTTISPTTAPGVTPSGWTDNGEFDVTVTCNDGGSGCDTIYYDANANSDTTSCGPYTSQNVGGSPASYTYTSTLCADGTDCEFTFCAYSVDNVGHDDQPATTVTYRIDRRDPEIDPDTFDDSPDNSRNPGWHNDDFTVSVDVTDFDGSQLDTCRITGPGGSTTTSCSGPGTITFDVTVGPGGICDAQGTCQLTVEIIDNVGNSDSATVEYDVDFPTAGGDSGVPSCTVTGTSASHRCVYTTAGDNTVYYGSQDETCSGTFIASVSSTDPNGADASGMYSLSWGSDGPVTPEDPVTYSGSDSTTYSYDMTYSTAQGGSPALSPRDVSILPEDNSEDLGSGSGNVGPACTFPVFYDNEDPTSTLDSASSSTGWTGGDVTFTIDATDDQVPVRTIWYDYSYTQGQQIQEPACSGDPRTYDAEPSTGVTQTINCPDGEICWARLCYAAEDMVANLEDVHTEYFAIDKTPPVVEEFSYDPAPRSGPGPELSNADDTWFNNTFTVSVPVTDTGSGIDECWYSINGVVSQSTNGCPAGDGAHGADGDLARNFTFQVSIPGDCPEGRDSCSIEAWAIDVVGNEAAHRTEVVSIDTTAPTCTLTTIEELAGGINQYYNASELTHYYNNQDADPTTSDTGTYRVEVSMNDLSSAPSVSGIKYVRFPALTDEEDAVSTREWTLDMGADHDSHVQDRQYSFDPADTYSDRNAQVIVEDEAGNANTCAFGVVLDDEPPGTSGNTINFDHASLEDPTGFDPGFVVTLGGDDADGSGLRNAQIRARNTSGSVTSTARDTQSNYLASCGAFGYGGYDPTFDPAVSTSPDGYSGPVTLNASEQSTLESLLLSGRGLCFQFYGLFFDNVNNYAFIEPPAGELDRVVAVDANPGSDVENACGFFGTFDNCNERARYVNGRAVDQYATTSCPGSCWEGQVNLRRPPVEQHENAFVNIVGIDRLGYSDRSESNGEFHLFDIDADPPREFTLQAAPEESEAERYSARSQVVNIASTPIDATNGEFPKVGYSSFTIGFRETECTSSCTLSSDPGIGTCRLDCAGFNGCPASGDTGYQALQACDGLSAGFVTSAGGQVYSCCTAQLAPDDISDISTDFEVNASEIVRNERLVYLGGRLVKLVVVTFERE